MPDEQLIKTLAKVMVAAAWADGEITPDEINSLKDLLFHLPGMTAEDWAEIDIYIDSPVEAAERERLVAELQASLQSPEQKTLAQQALDEMVAADGQVSGAESELIDNIQKSIQASSSEGNKRFSRFMRGRVQQRSEKLASGPNREEFMEDFVKNKIYYDLRLKTGSESDPIQLSESELRKLSLAGGLMSRIAFVDRQVTEIEKGQMILAAQRHWGLSPAQAELVVETAVSEISKGLDYYRLTREFFEVTTEDERLRFLDVLFAISASDKKASYEEMEDIRTISQGLLLSHQQFIEAKLKIPREQREL